MISINFCGWWELEVGCILISRRRIMLVDMATELTIWFYQLCRIVLCIGWVTTVLGRWIHNTGNPKDMIMWEMQTLDIKISNCTISLKLLLLNDGLSEYTRGIRELIGRLLSWSKLEITRDIWHKMDSIRKCWRSTDTAKRSENEMIEALDNRYKLSNWGFYFVLFLSWLVCII